MSYMCAIYYMEKVVQECYEMGAILWNRVPLNESDNTDQMNRADQNIQVYDSRISKLLSLNIKAIWYLLWLVCYV